MACRDGAIVARFFIEHERAEDAPLDPCSSWFPRFCVMKLKCSHMNEGRKVPSQELLDLIMTGMSLSIGWS